MLSHSVPAALALLSLAPSAARAALLQSADDAASQLQSNKYDYIIVGGGAAGGVLANRLTEDENNKVLLIEAGFQRVQRYEHRGAWLAPVLTHSIFDWNYTTTPQKALNNREVAYARGKVLGGSTSINYMIHTRGSEDDWNRYAELTGDDSWKWESVLPYAKKLENFTNSPGVTDAAAKFVPSVHGTSGPVGAALPQVELAIDSIAANAQKELSSEFKYNQDVNSGDMIGFSWTPFAIQDGARSNSAKDYIIPALSRSNLDVLVNTQVTKVLKTVYNITANKEVILSAGAIGSPHILLLSGIGPAEQSKSLGIESIVDLPDVGQNMQDHPLLTTNFRVTSNDTLDNLSLNATFQKEQLDLWVKNQTGYFTLGACNSWAWQRLSSSDAVFQKVADPSAGPTSPHYQLIWSDLYLSFSGGAFPEGHFLTLISNLYTPASRGSLTLNSTDPFAYPIIDPGLLSDENGFDIHTMREALRAGRRFFAADAWKDWIVSEFGESANATSDDAIDAYVRKNALVVNHVAGTVAVGKKGDSKGALNPDFSVKGVKGLRVIDASVFPVIPASHTMVPVYILAERAADLIKNPSSGGSSGENSAAQNVPFALFSGGVATLLLALASYVL